MIKFTKERVLLLYKLIVEQTGGTFGIKSDSLLESALEAPFQTYGGKDFFPTKLEKAARLGYGLVANHPFVDGNKRIGVYVMISFLDLNGIHIEFNNKELIDLGLGVASGQLKYEDIYKFLKKKRRS